MKDNAIAFENIEKMDQQINSDFVISAGVCQFAVAYVVGLAAYVAGMLY